MLDVAVIDDPAAAQSTLDPTRIKLLAALTEPGSASSLAPEIRQPRQKINYHLRALERHGLIELVEERRKGNMTERVLQATAASYVISPAALAAIAPDPDHFRDHLSARWLLALGARLVRDIGELIAGATAARKRLATFGMDTEIRFATAADRAKFVDEFTSAVADLVARYHDESAPAGRSHRFVVALHPTPRRATPEQAPEGKHKP